MSVVSNVHTAQVYDAKKSKPFDGQRLVVTIAKKDKDGNYGQFLQQTMATSIPHLTVGDVDFTNPTIQGICIDYFKTVQNGIIADNLKSGKKEVRTEDIGQDALVAYIFSESVGDKWDSARISGWFTEYLAIPYTEKLMENGVSDADIEKRVNATCKAFADSLGSKAKIPTKVADALTKLLRLAEGDMGGDAIYKRFYNRLNPPEVSELLDLGF